MKGLIQRVSHASVVVDRDTVGAIGNGILLLLGIEKEDDPVLADMLLEKVLKYRIFNDDQGRMNLGLRDVRGGLLIVSQFTLVADTRKGLRPGFSCGAKPEQGERLYNYFVERAKALHHDVATGRFGADMKVSLLNDGPVTFMLESREAVRE
ncbi:D-aminoacyl-tRNA deacylase [Endozoicomonas sp. ONNA2]|uniref:D-aminoacyl-tRNA deacylase n=1 Tax=Endozoicomonas sp. ONNA2 TaxID=2828741 RepID=UPI0021477D69|nr:D-aminoacyl-tRNA deacylase [Endozoicomonas sp. ONNA2]